MHFDDRDLSLPGIATTLHISSSYLGKLFRTETGLFFNEYLLKVRLQMAVKKLCNSRMSVGEIAIAVGFSNQSYFNKKFRQIYRMTPAEYRRSYEDRES